MESKECRICHQILPINEFVLRRDSKKYRNECNKCSYILKKDIIKKSQLKHKDKIILQRKKYQKTHKKLFHSYYLKRKKELDKCKKQKVLAFYSENKDKILDNIDLNSFDPSNMGFIYELKSDRIPDLKIRYIGYTVDLNRRIDEHLRESLGIRKPSIVDKEKMNWISKETKDGFHIIINPIDCCLLSDIKNREIFWIEHYKLSRFYLMNKTSGGDGMPGLIRTKEHKEKISKSLMGNKNCEGRVASKEEIKKRVSKLIGQKRTDEQKLNMSKPHDFKNKKTWRENMANSHRGLKRKNSSSKYIGVSYIPRDNKWRAFVIKNKKTYRLGHFFSEIEAAKAVDIKYLKLFGKKINFPD